MKSEALEHDIQQKIRIWCGEHNLLAIRINVGTFRAQNSERRIKTGPPTGWPDLMLFDGHGHTVFCECKAQYGRLRPEQKTVHEELRKRGFMVIVPRSLDEFVEEISGYEWFE